MLEAQLEVPGPRHLYKFWVLESGSNGRHTAIAKPGLGYMQSACDFEFCDQ